MTAEQEAPLETQPGPWADANRAITEAPGYVITSNGEIWSRPRTAAGKSGSVRTLQARRLKPDEAGRVSLSINGKVTRVTVADIHRQVWPEVVAAERMVERSCRKGHPLVPPNIAIWGSGYRVCLTCNPGWRDRA